MRNLILNRAIRVIGVLLAIIITLPLAVGVNAQTPEDPDIGFEDLLVAYYPFDGDTLDYSGLGYDGTNNGATFTPGVRGQAAFFNGTSAYIQAPVNINPDIAPQLTITCWARSDTIIGNRGTLASHDNGGFKRHMGIDNRGGELGWSAFSGSGQVLGFSPVSSLVWTFVAVVYDQTAGIVTLYVNDSVYTETGTLGEGLDFINIGRNPTFGEYFAGAIDELRIYDWALTASEISSLRGATATPSPTLTPAPPATTTQPATPTVIPGQTASLTWVDFGQDRVSTNGPTPDGSREGHFQVNFNVSGNKTIQTVTLFSANSAGEASGGQVWNSNASGGYWFLGVYINGIILGPQNSTVSGPVSMDLYGNDSGYFRTGQYFGVTVRFTDNTEVKGLTSIGAVTSPTVPATPSPTLTPAPPATTTPPATPTVVPDQTASLTWVDFGQDQVSTTGPNPDGVREGHFRVNLNVSGSKTIQTVSLYTTDSSGNPASDQIWRNPAPSNLWFLGVYLNGVILGPQNSTVSGPVSMDLYGNDSGFFNNGQYFGVTVQFTDNTEIKGLISIGAVTSPTVSPIPPTTTAIPTPPVTPQPRRTGTFTTGTQVNVTSSAVPPSGGIVTVNRPGDPLDGMQIEVPANSYNNDRTFTISYAPITSHTFDSNINSISPLIMVDNGGVYANELMNVKVPVSIPQGQFAMAFAYNEQKQTLEGLPLVTQDASSITFATRHFSRFLVAAIALSLLNSSEANIESGFRPRVDDWQFTNYGSFIANLGHCSGQSMTMMWYYITEPDGSGVRLFGRYDNNGNTPATPNFQWDDSLGYRFASVIQNDSEWDRWSRILATGIATQSDQTTWNLFAFSMLASNEPQMIEIWNTTTNSGHAMIVYRIANGTLYVSDPNYHGRTDRSIEFVNGRFIPYNSGANAAEIAAGRGVSYDRIVYIGHESTVDWSKVASRWTELKNGTIGNDSFPSYSLTYTDASGRALPLREDTAVDQSSITITAITTTPGPPLITGVYPNVNSAPITGPVTLQPGVNRLGVGVWRNTGSPYDPFYIDFKYINVVYSPVGTVVPPGGFITSILVTPENPPPLRVNQKIQFKATGVYANGATEDLTSEAEWGSSDPQVAIIAPQITLGDGLALGNNPGTTQITAFYGGEKAERGITSNAVTLTVVP